MEEDTKKEFTKGNSKKFLIISVLIVAGLVIGAIALPNIVDEDKHEVDLAWYIGRIESLEKEIENLNLKVYQQHLDPPYTYPKVKEGYVGIATPMRPYSPEYVSGFNALVPDKSNVGLAGPLILIVKIPSVSQNGCKLIIGENIGGYGLEGFKIETNDINGKTLSKITEREGGPISYKLTYSFGVHSLEAIASWEEDDICLDEIIKIIDSVEVIPGAAG